MADQETKLILCQFVFNEKQSREKTVSFFGRNLF